MLERLRAIAYMWPVTVNVEVISHFPTLGPEYLVILHDDRRSSLSL